MITDEEKQDGNHKTIKALRANWVWIPDWIDSSSSNTVGKIVHFVHEFDLTAPAKSARLHFSADTRYKLFVNGTRVAVGPARGSPLTWYYDSLDIAPYLQVGRNELHFIVLRYFASSRGAMCFERTALPGLTVVGEVQTGHRTIEISTRQGWKAYRDDTVQFPSGLVDDVFLHISERVTLSEPIQKADPLQYNIRTCNGDIAPWALQPRSIPLPESTPAIVKKVRSCNSSGLDADAWTAFFQSRQPIMLPAGSSHVLEVQADCHSTAFVKWTFDAPQKPTQVKLKVTYSEGYEHEPRSYPFFRSKADRLDAENGHIIGPYDDVVLNVSKTGSSYEPFWFRTFRILRMAFTVLGDQPVQLTSFEATQTNYPMAVKAAWKEPGQMHSSKIWEVSIRTMRNCMFDGYSDCPFYEQLQ